MCNAWDYAQKISQHCVNCLPFAEPHDVKYEKINLDFIEHLGSLVEPKMNKKGFRTIPIGIRSGYGWIEKAAWERVPELLTELIAAYYEDRLMNMQTNPLSKNANDEFYFHYEEIHPFRDGNGRTGKILYNYLNGTLDNPIMPPNFWGSSNP